MSDLTLILLAAAIVLCGIAMIRDHAADVLIDLAFAALVVAVLVARFLP